MGKYDPTAACEQRRFVKAHVVGDRVVRHELTWNDDVLTIDVTDNDSSASWARLTTEGVGQVFVPRREHLVLRHAVRELPGLCLLPVPWRFDLAAGFVLQQRVTFGEAAMQWKKMVDLWGPRSELGAVFPGATRVARLHPFELQALGVDPRRASTLIRLAREEVVHGLFAASDRGKLRSRMLAIPGIGPWTTEMTLGFADGDPDALPIGDLHLPELVASALAHERRGSDARMVELLETYRGHPSACRRLLWAVQFSRPDLLGRR